MSNGKVFYNNLISNTTVSASSEAAGFESDYLGNSNQGVVWRSTDISQTTLQMSFGFAAVVKGIVVLNHNLVSGDTFEFEASSNGFTSTAASISIDPVKGFAEVDWIYPDYRLRLQKVSGDYIQVGEIFLQGSVYEFERNYRWNYTYTREINRNSRQTTSGQIYRKTRFSRKGFDLSFDGFNDSQKDTFEGIAESDYICFLPNGSNGDLYYGIVDFSAFTHVFTNYWTGSLNFLENPK